MSRATGVYSIQRGPRKIKDFVGYTAALGPSGPRRECGARRRKPVCRATGVFNPEGSPQNQRFCGLLSSPRPFWAAPRVRRPTEEARVSGDRSLQSRGVPAKSKILWAAQQPSALLGRAASAASDRGSPCLGRPESIQSRGVPAKSKILWATQQPSALLGRAASAAADRGSPCLGRPESIQSRGVPAKSKILWGEKSLSPPARGQSSGP